MKTAVQDEWPLMTGSTVYILDNVPFPKGLFSAQCSVDYFFPNVRFMMFLFVKCVVEFLIWNVFCC